MEIP
ncbi:hypothetical protein M8C21_024185 [Ambrosia artemisiifolia]|jgi:hypothetical protein